MFTLMKTLRSFLGFAMAFAISTSVASAVIVDDFDSYLAGSSLAANGYTQFGGGASIVYPDVGSGLVPPTYPPLEGTQSVYIGGQFDGRGWGSPAAAAAVGDGAILSWIVRNEINAAIGQTSFYLSDTAGIGGGGTPGGIILDGATDLIYLSGATETATSFSLVSPNTYKLEMELNFTADTFDAYVTDVTGAGSRTFLGTKAFGVALSAAVVAADGGVLFGNTGGGSAAFWDEIVIVPEPTSIVLLTFAGLILGVGSRKRLRTA
jgi:hypothetical protein